MNTFNKHFNSSIEIIDEIHLDKSVIDISSDDEIIDISSDDEIIDITDTICIDDNNNKSKLTQKPLREKSYYTTHISDWGKHENSKTTSTNQTISLCNDVQILNHSACTQKNPIDIITISDDSDEENVLLQQSNKTKIDFNSSKNRFNNVVNPQKRTYSRPLRNCVKKSKTKHAHEPKTLTNIIEAFLIDKLKISNLSQNFLSSTTSKADRQLRPIIIDGLNIGYAHGIGTFSVKGIELCVKYFAKRGHKKITVFIPHHRQGDPGSKTKTTLHALYRKGYVCFTPSRIVRNCRMTCHDDRIMLNYASCCGGVVVSNDNFRDFYRESNAFKEIIEQRLVMITFVKDEIIVPDDQYNLGHYVRTLSDILCYP